jgi:hypothetical protein
MSDGFFQRASVARNFRTFVYVLGLVSGAGSYSKIKVVRYHTMDSAYSSENACVFLREAGDRACRVWYGGNGFPAALMTSIFGVQLSDFRHRIFASH